MDFSNQDLARAGLLEPAWRHRLMEQAVLQMEKPSAWQPMWYWPPLMHAKNY